MDLKQGRVRSLRASAVSEQPFGPLTPNSDLNAQLNGMDPNNPYVTQRPQQSYFWYKTSEGDLERRDPGVPLAKVDATLSCSKFRSADWLQANRPEWPRTLVDEVGAFSEAVPQKAIVMPRKNDWYPQSALRQLGLPTESVFRDQNEQ